jgi:hypothetical protein
MNVRELKALEIAARARIAFCNGVWIVPSQTTSGSYHVTIGSEPSCPCDDFDSVSEPPFFGGLGVDNERVNSCNTR